MIVGTTKLTWFFLFHLKALNKKRDELEIKVNGVISLGQGMMAEKLFDEDKEKEYEQRISSLKRSMKLLMKQPVEKKER